MHIQTSEQDSLDLVLLTTPAIGGGGTYLRSL